MKKRNKLLLLVLLVNVVIFGVSVGMRRLWYGVLTGSETDRTGHHQWLTGSAIVFTNNWRYYQPWKISFAMYQAPPSIETESTGRAAYVSYPPGTIIPLYLLTTLLSRPADPPLVMSYNLFSQFLITLMLSLIVYLGGRRFKLGRGWAGMFSLVPPLWMYLVPGPLYWGQNVFFSDQAVLLPVTGMILLELLSDHTGRKRAGLMAALVFWAMLTDWLALFVVSAIYLKRVLCGEIKLREWFLGGIKLAWPALLALGLFAWQLTILHGWEALMGKAVFRLGVAVTKEGNYYRSIILPQIKHHFETGWGKLVLPLYGLFPIFLLVSKKWVGKRWSELGRIAMLTFVPISLQMIVLNNHTTIHDFATYKVIIPLTVLVVTLWPVSVALVLKGRWRPAALTTILLLNIAYTGYLSRRYWTFFPAVSHEYQEIGTFVTNNTDYDDVVVSPDYEIPLNPPQLLSYSNKLVHRVNSPEEIEEITKPIQGEYELVILVRNPDEIPGWVQDYPARKLLYEER